MFQILNGNFFALPFSAIEYSRVVVTFGLCEAACLNLAGENGFWRVAEDRGPQLQRTQRCFQSCHSWVSQVLQIVFSHKNSTHSLLVAGKFVS